MFSRSKSDNTGQTRAAAPARPGRPATTVTATARRTGTDGARPAPAAVASDKALAPVEPKKRAETSKRRAAAWGEIVGLMAGSPRHRDYKLSDLGWLVLPAIRTGQYALAETQSKLHGYTAPVAAVLWARVSAEVDKRLEEKQGSPIRLTPSEWKSGEILWLVDTIGNDQVAAALVLRLRCNEWKGKPVKVRVTDAKGQATIRTLEALPPSNGAAGRSK